MRNEEMIKQQELIKKQEQQRIQHNQVDGLQHPAPSQHKEEVWQSLFSQYYFLFLYHIKAKNDSR